jgi:hypothetical protein
MGPPGLPPQLVEARTRTLRIAAAIAVVAALLSAAVGWFVRASTEPAAAPPPSSRTVHAGPVSVSVPAAWASVTKARGVPALDPASSSLFQPAKPVPAYVALAFAPAEDPSLVPSALRPLLPKRLPAPKPTSLGGARAWRYGELTTTDGHTIELTVAPSDRGVLAVACVATSEAWVAAIGCAEQLHSVSLPGAAWLRPGRDLALRAAIPGAIAKLDARRVAIRKKLRRAPSRRAQRRLGLRLSTAYANAADRLARVAPASGAPAAVVASLRGAAAANRHMAIAAGHGWPKRYRMARHAVKRADRSLGRSLAAVR